MRTTLLILLAAAQSLRAAPLLQPESSRQFFLPPDQPAVLTFRVPEGTAANGTRAVIRGLSGTAEIPVTATLAGPGRLQLGVKLPQGYHVVSFPEFRQEFGLVALPALEGPPDPFFGIDSSLSWLSKPAARKDKVEVLRFLGVSIARERLNWAQVQQKPGEFDGQTGRRYEEVRKLYTESGIKILEVFHNAPTWMNLDAAGAYPTDLVAASDNWQKVAGHWKNEWAALDIWNEPDIQFGGNQPADRYAALAKTIAYATRQTAPDVDLGAVVLAYVTMPFLDLVSRNGVLDQCDYFSFHFYKEPSGLVGHVRDIRTWLERSGHGSMPLWITEMGRSWVKSGNETRPAPAADLERALIFARDTVEARACGVAAIFPFVFVDYSEKGAQMFGMLDVQGSPQGSMAVYAQAIRMLRGTEYLGDLKSSPGSRVFQRSDGAVVIAYLGKELPAFPVTKIEGLDGRMLAAPADGLTYLVTTLDPLRDDLTTDTEAMSLHRLALAAAPPRSNPSPLVLFPQVKSEGVTVVTRGYQLPDKLKTLSLDLEIANLGAEEKTITVEVLPAGVSPAASAPPAGFLDTLKRWLGLSPAGVKSGSHALASVTAKIPPRTTVKNALNLDLAKLSPDAGGTAWLDFVPSDNATAPASIALLPSLGLAEHLKAYKYQFAVPIADLSRWTVNSSGHTTITKGPEGNWTQRTDFSGEGDRWSYPKFKLPQEVQNDRVGAVLVRARFRCPGDHSSARFMSFAGDGKMSVTGFSIIPNDGEWHVALIPLESFLQAPAGTAAGSQIQEISLGFNTPQNTGELEVSDLYLLGN